MKNIKSTLNWIILKLRGVGVVQRQKENWEDRQYIYNRLLRSDVRNINTTPTNRRRNLPLEWDGANEPPVLFRGTLRECKEFIDLKLKQMENETNRPD